jgi:hypothetical protein
VGEAVDVVLSFQQQTAAVLHLLEEGSRTHQRADLRERLLDDRFCLL